jgi:three-Cys-motif partner protein
MAKQDFHDDPYDEGTLTKLELFQLYARSWYPVFLASEKVRWPEVHVFDFFSGPGHDTNGTEGSPVRIVREAITSAHKLDRGDRSLHFHFFDQNKGKIEQLGKTLAPMLGQLKNTHCEALPLEFSSALEKSLPIINSPETASLIFLDPCAVNLVDENVIQKIANSDTTDFLLFVASSYFHRFAEHPSFKMKIKRSDSFYHCHRTVLEHLRSRIPDTLRYYLYPFSIKKASGNIYGVIFGTSHSLGMEKFLKLAWDKDQLNGEANYDLNREDIRPDSPALPGLEGMFQPTKLTAFEEKLERALREKQIANEFELTDFCFSNGVKRQHSESVLKKLKDENVLHANFRTPQLPRKSEAPRTITYFSEDSFSDDLLG